MKTPVVESFPMNIAKLLRIHILKNTYQWLLMLEDAKTLEKYFFLGI